MDKIKEFFDRLVPIRSFSKPARLFLIATIVDGVVYSAWSLFFNFYILSMGYDKQYLGILNSLPSLATLIFSIPMGYISDRIGRRKSMLIGVFTFIIFCGLEVTARDPILIGFAAFMAGVGQALYYVSQAPFMMKSSTPANRATLFSLNFGLITASGAIGSIGAGMLPGLFSTWLHTPPTSALAYQVILIMSVILGSISLIPLFLIKEPPEPVHAAELGKPSILDVARKPIVWQLFIPQFLIGIGAALMVPYFNVFFAERYGMSSNALGILFSLSALLTAIGTLIGPRLVDVLGTKIRTVVATQGISLIFIQMIAFSPWGWLAAIGFLMRGVLMNMASPLFSAFSMEETPPHEQGVVNSLLSIAWTFGWVVGPFISGIVQENFGYTPIFITTTILYAANTFLVWKFFRHNEAKHAAAQTAVIEA
ncbi:MAG TPA: MFS transporter [Longilinea sp.]|nr:MFS transporter [Longilinea sp.]